MESPTQTRQQTCRECATDYVGPFYECMGTFFDPCLCPDCAADEAPPKVNVPAADPEELMHRAGFRDPFLLGKHLGNFDAGRPVLQQLLESATNYARAQIKGQTWARGLFLVGAPGRGKTHLARGIARSMAQTGEKVKYLQLLDLISELKIRMNRSDKGPPDDLIDEVCTFPGLLILDELGRSAGRAWDRDLVFRIIDRRMTKPTVYCSNYDLDYLERHYDEAVVSRLLTCQRLLFPGSLQDRRRQAAAEFISQSGRTAPAT